MDINTALSISRSQSYPQMQSEAAIVLTIAQISMARTDLSADLKKLQKALTDKEAQDG